MAECLRVQVLGLECLGSNADNAIYYYVTLGK